MLKLTKKKHKSMRLVYNPIEKISKQLWNIIFKTTQYWRMKLKKVELLKVKNR